MPAFVHHIKAQLSSKALSSTKPYQQQTPFPPARYPRKASPWQELDDMKGTKDNDALARKGLPAFKQGQGQSISEIRRQQEFVVAFPEVARLSSAHVGLLHSK